MKKLLCFGDSNTYGYRYTDRGRFDENTRWTALLAKKLHDYDIEVIECGLNSRTTVFDYTDEPDKNGSKALPAVLKEYYPIDYAIVMLGTNDCKTEFHASADMIADGMDTIISQIQLFDSRTSVILVCPPCIDNAVLEHGFSQSFDKDSIPKSAELIGKFRQCALQHDCLYISTSDFVSTANTDGIHLDEHGHSILAQVLFDAVLSVPAP